MHIRPLFLLSLSLLTACGGGGGGGGDGASQIAGSTTGWLVPENEIRDGGPGKDGIPAISSPTFAPLAQQSSGLNALVIGVSFDGDEHAIPHDIMDWHEVLNLTTQTGPTVVSYCPLTGSALHWKGVENDSDATFGVSGLLYNSNLILYDRQTDSNWSQMGIQAIEGTRRSQRPQGLPLVEMTLGAWQEMYPDSLLLSRTTGFSRDYGRYPYGSFRTNTELLFPVDVLDNRLHEKARVLGVFNSSVARAYVIDDLEDTIEVINDDLGGEPIVVVGSATRKFAVAFSRTLADGTELTFLPSSTALPSLIEDQEGNTWDVFGRALTGPREGESLTVTQSHIAYWFAWGAFHKQSEIHNQGS